MKTKVIGLLLVLVMLVSMQSALGDSSSTFEPDILNQMGLSPSEWYLDDTSCALFALSVIIDGSGEWDSLGSNTVAEAIIADSIYICKNNWSVVVIFFGLDNYMICDYNTLKKTAGFTISDFDNASADSDYIMELLVARKTIQMYKQIDSDCLFELITTYTK